MFTAPLLTSSCRAVANVVVQLIMSTACALYTWAHSWSGFASGFFLAAWPPLPTLCVRGTVGWPSPSGASTGGPHDVRCALPALRVRVGYAPLALWRGCRGGAAAAGVHVHAGRERPGVAFTANGDVVLYALCAAATQ